MKIVGNINELTKLIVPLTYFRRHAGEVINKLKKTKVLLLVKEGKPIAKLSLLENEVNEEKKGKSKIAPPSFRFSKPIKESEALKLFKEAKEII
mgnify:CR=1 FL=1